MYACTTLSRTNAGSKVSRLANSRSIVFMTVPSSEARNCSTWRTAIASMMVCLSGKNRYSAPIDSPASAAIRVVVTSSSGICSSRELAASTTRCTVCWLRPWTGTRRGVVDSCSALADSAIESLRLTAKVPVWPGWEMQRLPDEVTGKRKRGKPDQAIKNTISHKPGALAVVRKPESKLQVCNGDLGAFNCKQCAEIKRAGKEANPQVERHGVILLPFEVRGVVDIMPWLVYKSEREFAFLFHVEH